MPHTNIILKFFEKSGLNFNTVETLFKEAELKNCKYKLQLVHDDIYTLTIYSRDESEFESKRDFVILKLRTISDYLSVTHDSITKSYIDSIGESIYELERKFRTLIEYAFLKKIGPNWAERFNIIGHDRRTNREDVIKNLNNPLDDWDFIHLSKFVNENITVTDKDYLSKLKALEQSITTISTKSDLESTKDQILEKVQELLNIPNKKGDNFRLTDFYSHLKSSLVTDWNNLYRIRNLWAHNTALMTRKEYETYKRLCESVLNNIHTEITINGLFDNLDAKYIEIGGESLKIILYKATSEGRAMVHLKGKIKESGNKNVSFKKNSVTYIDIIELFNMILKESDYAEIDEITAFANNPLLRENLLFQGEIVSSTYESLPPEKKNIEPYLLSNGFEVFTDSLEVIMSESVDEYLRIIF